MKAAGKRAEDSAHGTIIPLEEFMKNPEPGSLPYILNISKGRLDKYIEENFDDIVMAVKSTGILIGNPGWIRQFTDEGVTVYGDYGLNAFNSQCVKAYEEIGVEMLYLSHETGIADDRFVKELGDRGDRDVPLMITEHPLQTEHLVDRKGEVHSVVRAGDKYLIF